jgi:hypothetical protein
MVHVLANQLRRHLHGIASGAERSSFDRFHKRRHAA